MDLVGALSNGLGLEENAARGLAGQVLGLVEELVREKISFGTAARMRDAIPEMSQWQLAAPTMRPGTLSLTSIDTPTPGRSELELLLERFQVELTALGAVRALTLEFLTTRLERGLLAKVVTAMP